MKLSPQSQRILEMARHDYKIGGTEALSIIRELLLLVQAQGEALGLSERWFSHIYPKDVFIGGILTEDELNAAEENNNGAALCAHNREVISQALAHADEVMERLGGEE